MKLNRHYWQLVLFVVVLILPSALVAVEGWKNVKLDRENRLKEAEENDQRERVRARTEIGKDAWERLQNIKLQEIGSTSASDPAVKFIAWVSGDKLVMPWDDDPRTIASRQAWEDPAFARTIDDAETAEVEKRLDDAILLYRKIIQSTANDYQRAYGRLALAKVLGISGAQAEARGVYREVLSLSSDLIDKEGFSFAVRAAGALVDSARAEVLARASRDLDFSATLTLGQAYSWLNVVKSLGASASGTLQNEAKGAADRFSNRIAALEEARRHVEADPEFLQLSTDFHKLGVTEKAWLPFGRDLLISRVPERASFRPLVIAASRERIFESVRTSLKPGLPFTIAFNSPGEPLDEEHFPGLKVSFANAGSAGPSGVDFKNSFYVPSIFLLISLNLFGAYLLWRDTRREMRVSDLRSQFVASVSHELKTPLTAIRMFAEILQSKDSVDAETRTECLDTIVNESERLTRLLNNVLDFSRIEHGQKTYRMESTCLSEIVMAAAKTMRHPLAEQGFNLSVDVADNIPPVKVDRDALKQAVLNLLTNAMKYSGQSRGIELRLFPHNGEAFIQVADHGIGIPAGEQPHIFEKFYRARVPENNAISGTGLGLSLVAHVVEGHGGTVEVESSPGGGSTFSIRIPVGAEELS